MQSIRAKWSLTALALIINLGGGPMAWAHLAAAGAAHAASATQMPADCAEHAQPDRPTLAHPMPCCDTGACECATPPAPPALTLEAPADLRHDTFRGAPATRLISPDPLDDTLRPPIR